MPTGWTEGLWRGESDKIIFACVHCGEKSEAGAKPFPRGLCENCLTMEKRRDMHEENETVNPHWFCKVCQKLSTSAKNNLKPATAT